ncbi:MAG: metal ABC transporter permease, partial [Anaerolineae bacterium]|nr:metal ABC transporter permease [Anaerolineae bacterium]
AWLGVSVTGGAIAFSLLTAVIIGTMSLRRNEHADTLIGAVWVVGMSIGIMFLYATPGYAAKLENFLFGNILFVSPGDLWVALVLDVLILAVVALFYREFLALSLDEEFTWLRGVPVAALYILLLCLVALTVVILIRVVGIVLLIALLTFPAAISRWYVRHLHTMMISASLWGIVFIVAGIAVSYATDFPSGACIVLTAAAVYIGGYIIKRLAAMNRGPAPANEGSTP